MTMRLFVLSPAVVFAARVNQSLAVYPTGSVVFDGVTTGAYTDIKPGMTVMFGSSAGANDYGTQRIRVACTSDTLHIGRSSAGKFIGEVTIVDNAYITVVDDYRVWSKMPYITTGGIIYKDHNLLVSDRTAGGSPPVANIGVGFADTIDSVTSLITASWDASTNSFATADGETIASYAWDVGDGTITVGSSSTAAITATFPAGKRWVELTVTDTAGNTHTAHAPVFARDPASDDTISTFQITSHRVTTQGQTISLRIREELPKSTYPDGTLVMLWEGEPADESDRSHMVFIGWHYDDPSDITSQKTATLGETTLNCVDVAGMLDKLPGFSQEVEGASSPATWLEMKNQNMDKYLHYLLQWHSTALGLADWTWSGTTTDFPFVTLGSDGESLFDQVDKRAKALVPDYVFTCNRKGQLAITVDPMLQDAGDRTATEQTSVTISDWNAINYTAKQPTIHWHRGKAVIAHATEIASCFCVAPGETPGQGRESQERGEQLTVSQSTLNACEGHRYARVNAPEGLYTIELSGSDWDIEPADLTWVPLTITDAVAAKRDLSFTDERGLCNSLNVSYQHTRTGLVKTVTMAWERETSGLPAVTYIPETSTYDYPEWSWDWGAEPVGELSYMFVGLVDGVQTMAGFDQNGNLFITTNYDATTPTWAKTTLGLSGTLITFVVDPFSTGYVGGGSSVDGWILTTTDIYKIDDIFGSVSTSSQHTFAYAALYGNMDFSFGVEGWGVVAIYSTNGVRTTYTVDGGATWSAENIVTGVTRYNPNVQATPGVRVSQRFPGECYIGAFVDSLTGRIFKSVDYGASWTADPDHYNTIPLSVGNDFHIPYDDNADDSIMFYGWATSYFSHVVANIYKATGLSYTHPLTYGPYYGRWSIDSSPTDRQRMVIAWRKGPPETDFGLSVSSDGGDTWTNRLWLTNTEMHAAISGNNSDVVFLWGTGKMQVSNNFALSFDDKYGNLGSLGAGTFKAICGGPTS